VERVVRIGDAEIGGSTTHRRGDLSEQSG
jgi:hypothetical protein